MSLGVAPESQSSKLRRKWSQGEGIILLFFNLRIKLFLGGDQCLSWRLIFHLNIMHFNRRIRISSLGSLPSWQQASEVRNHGSQGKRASTTGSEPLNLEQTWKEVPIWFTTSSMQPKCTKIQAHSYKALFMPSFPEKLNPSVCVTRQIYRRLDCHETTINHNTQTSTSNRSFAIAI